MTHARFMPYRVGVICRQMQKGGAVNHRSSEARLIGGTVITSADGGIYTH